MFRPAPQTAMVLAAGLGTRMRPLTETVPKPLVRVGGKALIDHCLDDLDAAGIKRIVVNVHHLADKVEAHLGQWVAARAGRPQIVISDERGRLLETGGGIARALPDLGEYPFFLRNSDSFWLNGVRGNLDWLHRGWNPRIMDALLLLAPTVGSVGYRGRGDFLLDKEGRLTRRPERTVTPFIYSGAAILDPGLFAGCPEGPFSLNILFDRAIEAGRLFGVPMEGLWINVENLDAARQAEALLSGRDGL